jgi:RNA polymerase sigma-70 factor, ECF subfamily
VNAEPASTALRGANPPFGCVASAWTAHGGELRAYLRHRLGDAAAADDILQDIFVKAMRQQSAFCSLDNRRAWLFQVARNALIDRARTAHPAEPIELHEGELLAPEHETAAPVDALVSCLESAIDRLSPDDAAILRACDIQRQSQRDFAAAHGLSLPAAKSRLLRARERLRERLIRVCGVRFDVDGTVCCHAAIVPESPARPTHG